MYAIRSADDPSYFYCQEQDDFTTSHDERSLYETEEAAFLVIEEGFVDDPELGLEIVWLP